LTSLSDRHNDADAHDGGDGRVGLYGAQRSGPRVGIGADQRRSARKARSRTNRDGPFGLLGRRVK